MYFPPQSLENITLYVSVVRVHSSPQKPCIQCVIQQSCQLLGKHRVNGTLYPTTIKWPEIF